MATLTYHESRFIWIGKFEERDIPKTAGFRWNGDRRCWWTDRSTTAAKLARYADDAAKAKLGEVQRVVEASRAGSTVAVSLELAARLATIVAADGARLLPYQGAGIAALVGRPAVLLGDEMGLGKTVQALVSARLQHGENAHVLIVAPKATLLGWEREAERWLGVKLQRVRNGKDDIPKTGWVLCPWSRVVSRGTDLRSAGPWHTLILDESHYAKNEEAARTVAALGQWGWSGQMHYRKTEGLIDATQQCYALTGTPIPNRPKELRALLSAFSRLDKNPWLARARSWKRFTERYCDLHREYIRGARRAVWNDSGASHLDELQDELRAGGVMVRRLKADVMAELPPVRRQVLPIEADSVPEMPTAWDVAALAEQLARGSVPSFEEISQYRHDLGVAKVPVVVEHLLDMLEDGEKAVVVFTHHRDVAEAIRGGLVKEKHEVLVATGEDSPESRQAKVDAFAAGDGRVFIGTIGATGIGMNGLQKRTDLCVFAELDWVPGNIDQAIGRLHRIGQAGSVLAQFIVTPGDLDAYILDTVMAKKWTQDQALDLPSEMEAALAEAGDLASLSGSEAAGVPRFVTGDDLRRAAACQAAAQRLTGLDPNGARELNGTGWSAVDCRFGRILAVKKVEQWTSRMLAVAVKVLVKYKATQIADLWPEIARQ